MVFCVGQGGEARNCWQRFLEHFHALAAKLRTVKRDALDITTWLGEAGDNAIAHSMAW